MLLLLKKIKFRHFFWIFFYIFIFGLLLQAGFAYLDPDFGWHLEVGREISLSKAVPHANLYNYTYTGNWVDHEWLSNYLIYQVYGHFGYQVLVIIFALIILLLLILMNIVAHRRFPSRQIIFILAFFQVFGVMAALPHFGVRIQELALLFLFLLLYIIYFYNKNKNWRWFLVVVPFFYLWACLHASFLIGFFVLFSWPLIKLGERLLSRYQKFSWLDFSNILSLSELRNYLLISALAVVATLFTPYYGELYAFLGGYSNTFYLSYIQEWISQFMPPLQYYQLGYMALVVLALLIRLYWAIDRKCKRLDLWSFFLTTVFLALSFKSRRHFPLLFVVSFLFLIETYLLSLSSTSGKKTIEFKNKWLNAYMLLCLFLVSSLKFTQINFISDPFSSFCYVYPCKAIEFLKNNPQYEKLNMLNEYNWGGFMVKAYPGRLLFIDGRLPQVAYAGHTLLEEYTEFFKKDANYSDKLNQYNIKLALIQAKDKKIKLNSWERRFLYLNPKAEDPKNWLRAYLETSPDWQLIYSDNLALIYLKK